MAISVEERRKRRDAALVIGGVAALALLGHHAQQAAKAQPGEIPTGVPHDGQIRVFVRESRLGTRLARTALVTTLVVRNGTDQDALLALTADAAKNDLRGGAWASVTATIPFMSKAHTEDTVAVPAWSIERGKRYQGSWKLRARAWTESGQVLDEVIVPSYVQIS